MSNRNNKRIKRENYRKYKDSINLIFGQSAGSVKAQQTNRLIGSNQIQLDDVTAPITSQSISGSDGSFRSDVKSDSYIRSDSEDDLETIDNDNSETTGALTSASIREHLRNWSLRHGITLSATTDLLKILQPHKCFSSLPLDARALLQTPRYSCVKEVSPGSYIKFEWKNRILDFLRYNMNKTAALQVNIDGIPVYKSSNKCFWPILGCFVNTNDVFCMGLWIGKGKPENVNFFLEDFVNEYLQNQSTFGPVKLKIASFICDAPARSYITGIKNHTGYFGCAKCTTRGKYVENRVTFPELDAAPRTDVGFRSKHQPEHHNEDTLLLNLPMNMVDDIPYEYMHLIALGVTRKLLYLWTTMKKSPARLPRHMLEKLNTRIAHVAKYTPCEFCRKPRSVLEIDHWKATELRQFLIYTGPVILKGILPSDQYRNFLSLSVATRLLLSRETYREYNDYAHNLLVHFVKCFGMLYGEKYVSYNIHGLIHVASDSLQHGCLDNYSGFKFENHLQKIKRLVRSPFQALQQVHNRIAELDKQTTAAQAHGFTKRREDHSFALLRNSGDSHFSVYTTNTAKYKLTKGNNCVLLKTGEIGKITSFIVCDNEQFILFEEFDTLVDYFDNPCESSSVKIFEVRGVKTIVRRKVDDIKSKVYLVPVDNKRVTVPIVHSD